MLFHSSLRQELARTFGATLIILLTIVVTVMLMRTLGRASLGRINPSEVLIVLGFTVLGYLATIITLSLFVAVTITLKRRYDNREMVVWFSCGQGLFSFLRPLLVFTAPVVLAVALLALLAWPWSNLQNWELRHRFQGRQDVERVAPGRFMESAGGQRVFFIEKDPDDSRSARNIFISSSKDGLETVIGAHSGTLENEGDDQFLVLHDGFRMESNAQTGAVRISEFSRYRNRIETQLQPLDRSDSPKLKPSLELLSTPNPDNLAELSWRLGLVLAALNSVLIALAVTRSHLRAGRNSSLIFALFSFATYYNLIVIGQNWIERELIGMLPFLLLLHGGVALAALGWMKWRERGGPRPRAPAPA